MLRRTRRTILWALKETQNLTIGAVALAILRLRNAQSVYLGVGATAAGLTAKVLKRFIRQPRPERAVKETYGMPSTHSCSMSFIGAYLSCLALLHPPPNASQPLPLVYGLPLSLLCMTVASAVCWSRIYLGHHTAPQVFAGASLGISLAGLAYVFFPTRLGQCIDRITAVAWPLFVEGIRNVDLTKVTDSIGLYLPLMTDDSPYCSAGFNATASYNPMASAIQTAVVR